MLKIIKLNDTSILLLAGKWSVVLMLWLPAIYQWWSRQTITTASLFVSWVPLVDKSVLKCLWCKEFSTVGSHLPFRKGMLYLQQLLFLASTLLLLPKLTRSFKPTSRNNLIRQTDLLPSSKCQFRESSIALLAYTNIAELNEEIKKDSSKAYELFNKQKGVINFETAYLTLAALTQQGRRFLWLV